ncbi:hypothetical protein GMDG_04025 [Pseudogymnoascus destructans 20631-21]|uniref:Uncharacterized protein n=1 Tax=Pseudogymnoascus destructans (strain ATCC MYA-4855 / 20631-21) TaxID=658429 RepID=L8G8H1_PSED2|nr:hypothetical protein GMDG_04025 [Pseudogymnoascus destructans 20631-21]
MPALPPSERGPHAPASSKDDAPAGLAAYISAGPPTWIVLGGCYLLYRAARIRMRRRAQADDLASNDDKCDCDDKAGWIGSREEGYRDDPVDAEAHRLRAEQLAKEAYLDRDMNPPFHNTEMPISLDWPSKSQDPSKGKRHVTPPPPPPPTSAPAVIDGPAYTWQEDQSSIPEFSIADMAASAAAAGIYPQATSNPSTPPTTSAAVAPATPATEPKRRAYSMTAAGVEVVGEIVTGEGWRRHTRVYGGGVCLACLESERMRVAMGVDAPPGGPPTDTAVVEGEVTA